MSCDMFTPEQAHQHGKALKRVWKNYYKAKEPDSVNI